MEDKDKKKNVKKIIVYAVLLVLIMGIALGTGQIQTEELGRIFTVNAVAVCKLLLLIFGVLFLKSLIVWILGLIKPANHRARSVLSLLSSLTKYIAFLVILCAGLTILGVNMTTIIASVGVLALIVGFSAESLIADVVTGTFMLLENQYNVGDIVEVNGFRGTVTSIGIRTTCITDTGDNVKIINNSEMKNILNRSDNYSKAVCDISIPYETDLEKLESELPKLLESIYKAHEDTMKKVPVYVVKYACINLTCLTAYACDICWQALQDSGILLRFVVEVSEKNIYSGMRILNHDLLLGFRKLGVECPFPQLDVHNK